LDACPSEVDGPKAHPIFRGGFSVNSWSAEDLDFREPDVQAALLDASHDEDQPVHRCGFEIHFGPLLSTKLLGQGMDAPFILDDAFGDGVTGQAGHLMDIQLVHDLLTVLLNGLDADAKLGGNLFVGMSFSD
jgi:hypothetical protein